MSRYTAQMVERAKQHVEAGWSLEETASLLADEFDRRPGKSTIHAWVNPRSIDRSRTRYRSRERALKVHQAPTRPRGATPERALERMRKLYRRGLGLRDIGQVAAVWWGEELTEAQVKSRLGLKSGEVVAARSAA